MSRIPASSIAIPPEYEKTEKVESRKPISEAKKQSNKKWNDANLKNKYDHVHLVLDKGRKSQLQAHAQRRGESLNGFIVRAITETETRDNTGDTTGGKVAQSPAAEPLPVPTTEKVAHPAPILIDGKSLDEILDNASGPRKSKRIPLR